MQNSTSRFLIFRYDIGFIIFLFVGLIINILTLSRTSDGYVIDGMYLIPVIIGYVVQILKKKVNILKIKFYLFFLLYIALIILVNILLNITQNNIEINIAINWIVILVLILAIAYSLLSIISLWINNPFFIEIYSTESIIIKNIYRVFCIVFVLEIGFYLYLLKAMFWVTKQSI